MKKALSLLFLFVVLLFRVSADTSPPGTEPEYEIRNYLDIHAGVQK